jgi:RimJ/RimL family protein N-acetyltransferase
MKAPEVYRTERLVLRRPRASDAAEIFGRYSSDPAVTKYVGWPRHVSTVDTEGFLAISDSQWNQWPAGPYLIESHQDNKLLGSTGLGFDSPTVAATGYVLARDSWGMGLATEALTAMVAIAQTLNAGHIYALVHPDHMASIRVLDKCGFRLEQRLAKFLEFPNLDPGQPQDCLRYGRGI